MSKKKKKTIQPSFKKPGWMVELPDGRKGRTIAGTGQVDRQAKIYLEISPGKFGEMILMKPSKLKFLSIINLYAEDLR